jgi:hypothetical protein
MYGSPVIADFRLSIEQDRKSALDNRQSSGGQRLPMVDFGFAQSSIDNRKSAIRMESLWT